MLSAEVCGSFIPRDLDRIRLLLSPVVVPENKASDDIDLEYQLQMTCVVRSKLTADERWKYSAPHAARQRR